MKTLRFHNRWFIADVLCSECLSAGLLTAVSHAFQKHVLEASVAQHACSAIAALAKDGNRPHPSPEDAEENKQALFTVKAALLVIQAMNTHLASANADVQSCACLALVSLGVKHGKPLPACILLPAFVRAHFEFCFEDW